MSLYTRFLRAANSTLMSVHRYGRPTRTRPWKRPKYADRKLRDPDFLEHRETVSDTFFVALQAAGASLLGGIAAEKARDPFEITNHLEMSISGAAPGTGVELARNSWINSTPSTVVLPDQSPEGVRPLSGVGLVTGPGVVSIQLTEDPTADQSRQQQPNAVFPQINPFVPDGLGDVLGSEFSRPHNETVPPAQAPVPMLSGASAATSADISSHQAPPIEPFVEIAAPAAAASITTPIRELPTIPQAGQPGSNGQNTSAELNNVTLGPEMSSGAEPQRSPTFNGAESLTSSSAGTGMWSADAGSESQSSLSTGGASASDPSGAGCLISGLHLGGAPGGGPISDGGSCDPPGPMSLSASDPLFVLNWNEGLVAAPGVVEFDKPGDTVELRSNVYGNTVQSYSWDGGEFTRTLKDGTAVKFNSSGYQTSIIDLNSNRVTFTYDGSNNISTVVDQNSLTTTFSYSGSCGASGHVCTITDPANRTTSLTYNASGRLEKATDPDGAIFTFTYDSSSGPMLTLVDPTSNTTSFSYNFAGRASSITRPDSTTESFTALQLQSLCDTGCTSGSPGTPLISAEAVADYTDSRTNAWDYRLDWRGLGSTTQLTDPLGQTEAAGHMIVWHRDSNGLASQVTDRLDRDSGLTRDSKGNVTKITHPDGNNIQFEFNSNSQPTKRTDELGRVTTWTYDSTGNLTQITEADPDGGGSQTSPVTTMTYDSQGRMETLKDARSNTTTFSFDSRDRVTQITFPDDDGVSSNNPKVTFTFDSASNVETRIDERGNTTSFTYDGMNRLKTTTTPDRDGAGGLPAPITSLTYDNAGNLTQLKRPDPDGTGSLTSPTFTFTYNSMNRLSTQVDALSNTSTFVYDNNGNVTVTTDPLTRTTTYTYNELNYRTVVTEPDPDGAGSLTSPVTSFSYDAEGENLTIKDPLSRTTTFTYTNRGWQQTVKDALSNTTTFSYDAVGNPTSSQQPAGGGTQNYQYDALNRVTRAEDGVGNATTFTYDPVGNRISSKNGLGLTTSFSYEARNRLLTITEPDPDGAGSLTSPVTTMAYDLAGNRTAVTDPLGRIVTNSYDAANRLTSVTQPDPDGAGSLTSPITTFTYDNLERMTSLKDPVNSLTSWTYDAMDQVLTEIDPLSKTVTTTYDAAGQVTTIVDRKNQRRDFVYDNDGRLTQEKWCTTATGSCTTSRIFTYTYDAASQLTEVNETDSRYTFTYDNAGRTTGISSLASNMPSVRLTNVYDAAGNRTSVSDNLSTAGTISFTYDAAQRMTGAAMTVGASSGPEATFTYDAANRLTAMTRRVPPGGTQNPRIESTFGYDNTDRLTALTHTFLQSGSSPTTLATYTYSYDAASELSGETNADGTYTYTYDNTSQLTGVDASGGTCGTTGCDESFSYDVNGNRTMTGYTTGTGNRLTSDGTWNYTYDDNGNMLTKTRISDSQKYEFAWDYRDRLTQVLLKNSGGTILQQTDYTYDAFDRRIIKTHDPDGPGSQSATTTKTIYDGSEPVANPYSDFDGSNSLTTRYLYGPSVDMVLARRSASGTDAWYLTDHLGSVRDIANTSGTVIDHISYSVYGNVTNETQSSNGDRFKYTGREFDSETVLHSYRARIYDASIGRFLSTDPISFSGDDENLYRYVRNAPTGWTDETGQSRRYGSGDWVDKAANYFAGIGDSLTFHATYAFREALGINGGIDTGSGYYIAGEITEMTAEITVSAGGAALRRAAAQVVHKTAGAAARKQAAKAIPHIPTDAARHHINTLFGYPAIPGGRAWRPARFPTGGFSAKWNSCWANLKVVFDDVHDLLGRRAHLVEEFVYHTTTAEFISARAVVNTLFTKTEEHEQQANPPQ